MKKLLLSVIMVMFLASAVFSEDLNPGYRKAFGNGVIIACNGDYPPVSTFNPSQFIFEKGSFNINISTTEPVNLRAISPAGKRWKNYYSQVIKKEYKANLKYKKEDVFYWQIWTDIDSEGNPIDQKKNPWPSKAADIPNWEPAGWFTTKYDDEAGEWDTLGINESSFKENAFQFFFNSKPGQKYYITVSVGYSYIADAGQMEQKWNSVLKRFESVESSGELGFSLSSTLCGGTITVITNAVME